MSFPTNGRKSIKVKNEVSSYGGMINDYALQVICDGVLVDRVLGNGQEKTFDVSSYSNIVIKGNTYGYTHRGTVTFL